MIELDTTNSDVRANEDGSSSHLNGITKDSVENEESRNRSETDNDEDPVVHEIPVFLSKSLAKNLYLFQYPVRPSNMPYDNSSVISSKFRSGQEQIELSVAIDTRNPNFDHSKGEQIALNVDGCSKIKNVDEDGLDGKLYPSGVMDKQVLSSSKALKDTQGRYAVGILGGNELHVTPLSGIINLRPDLNYLDKSDKTAKKEGRVYDDPDDPIAASLEAAEELKPVTVKFAKTDQETAKKYREKSYEYQQKKAEEEPWIQTRFHHVKSAMWEEESQKLFCKKMDEEIQTLNQMPAQYLRSLTSDDLPEDPDEVPVEIKKE